MTDPDVHVVGGGPTGVTTALLLAQRGHSVRVSEQATEIYDLPRAIVMDDEILRVIAGLGLGEGLRAITTPMRGAEFVDRRGERIIGIELPEHIDWASGHPPTVAYYQPELESFLRAAAVAAGVDLRLGVSVGSVEQNHNHVDASTSDGETVRSHWLVAADGASSPIRKQLGIGFVDQGFDQEWLVVDIRLTRAVPTLPPFVQQICDPERPTTYVVGHADYRRWEFQLQPGETRDELSHPQRVWELLSRWLSPDDAELVRAVVYRFHATVADRMRAGRVFLAGDAGHQMPPFLGQGLCSGIRDAVNLAWKLDLVERGLAGDLLLDSYDEERLPHATAVVAHAVATGRLIDQLSGRADNGIALDAAYGGNRPFPHLSGGVLIGDHPAVGRQVPQPRIDGRRLDELLGRGFGVLVDDPSIAEPLADRWAELGTVVRVDPLSMPFTLPVGGAVIVRPDRYVAAVANNRAELVTATQELFTRLGRAATTTGS
jgi:3-(3-hydroxy-phenyl)propionate hydroxylase